ncbi:hypothetical protein P689_12213 [Candidatus Riesia pediculischaeffi PTSU]|uniref:Uncharacterized protein n=1 Tax=Candidatus Riesia pediculischaeffi PTSU TaxID=1401651 RepID=A0A0C1V604_9ENTR|nr:hypothetical protein P689_12213 [Candidatus Riesia pediculischaeffi PTSU]
MRISLKLLLIFLKKILLKGCDRFLSLRRKSKRKKSKQATRRK